MPKRTWFTMAAGNGGQPADISIYDEIGYWGVTAVDFDAALRALGTVSAINLRINSPGGDVFQGVAIYNMLARHPANVTVTVDGLAASIASLIAMSGNEILMPENAMMLIHNPSGGAWGTADDMDDMAKTLRAIGASVVNTYENTNRAKLPRADIEALLSAETWLSAQDAVTKGFADKVVDSRDITALYDPDEHGWQKMPRIFLRKAPDAVEWTAVPAAEVALYRVDEPADFVPATAATEILAAANFKAGATAQPEKARPGFLFVNAKAPTLAASYRMPIARLVDGAVMVTANALHAAAAELDAATDIADEEKQVAAASIAAHRGALNVLGVNAPSEAASSVARVAAEALAKRTTEILAACELAGVTAKQARVFLDGGETLDQVRVKLQTMQAGPGGSGGGGGDINPHNPGGGSDPDATAATAGWKKAIARHNAGRERFLPAKRA